MSTSLEQAAERMVRLRHKNLAYFSKHFPAIYNLFKDKKLERVKVNVLPERDETDLWVDGRSVYGERAKAYARQEVDKFTSVFSPGKPVDSVPPPAPGSYAHPRFAHRKLDNILRLSPLDTNKIRTYTVTNFYPLICFLGVGLGYHIERMVMHHRVENLIVFEPDLDVFNATLYTVDWEEICRRYVGRADRFIHFIISGTQDEHLNWAAVWNVLINQCPIFPVMTLFYNHLGGKLANYISDRVNEDMYVFLSSWGHFDDELRQLNNALHAFHQGIQWIPGKNAFAGTDLPVVILGSGPSLESRIEALKANRNKCLIVSAGTAIKVLEKHDIVPDIHVELESDSVTVRALRQVSPEFLKRVNLVAASQVAPKMWQMFGSQRMFFKRENAIWGYFGEEDVTVADGTPTCTNAAMVLLLHWGFRKFILSGTDYGYRDRSRHHASGTVYEDAEAKIEYRAHEEFETAGVDGKPVITQPVYYSSKRKIETVLSTLRDNGVDVEVWNSSDGARIEGAEWVSVDEFAAMMTSLPDARDERNRIRKNLFIEEGRCLPVEEIERRVNLLHSRIREVCLGVASLIQQASLTGKRDMQRLITKVTRALEGLKNKDEPTYYFIRGAIRHIEYVGYSHVMALPDDEVATLQEFLLAWKEKALELLEAMPEHFLRIAGKERFELESDPWVEQSIHEEEEGIDERLPLKFTLGNIFWSDIIKE